MQNECREEQREQRSDEQLPCAWRHCHIKGQLGSAV